MAEADMKDLVRWRLENFWKLRLSFRFASIKGSARTALEEDMDHPTERV